MEGRKFAYDVSWIFTSAVFVGILSFLRRPVMAYYVGASGLGLFAMLYGVASLFYMLNLGVPAATIKYIAEYKDEKETLHQFVSASVVVSLFLGILTGGAIFVTAVVVADFFHMPELAPLLRLFALGTPPYFVFTSALATLNGLREMKKASLLNSAYGLLGVAFTVVPLFLGYGLTGMVVGIVVSSVVSAGIALSFLGTSMSPWRMERGPVKKLLSFGVQTVFANVGTLIQYETDTLMIGYFMTPADVGIYSVSASVAKAIWIISQSISTVSYPTFSYYWGKQDYAAVKKLFDKCLKYTASILMPIGLAIALFGRDFILFLFKEPFLPAVLPLQVLLIGTVVKGSWVSVGSLFSAIGRVDLGYKVAALASGISIVLNYVFIPSYGILGAAYATVLSFLAVLAVNAYLAKKIVDVEYDRVWVGRALAATLGIIGISYLGMGAVTAYVPLLFFGGVSARLVTSYAAGAAFLSLYTFLIYRVLLKREDREYVRSMMGEVRRRSR